MKQQFTIRIPTYRTLINVSISDDKRQLDRWHNKTMANFPETSKEPFNASGASYEIYLNKDNIRCADIILKDTSVGVIAHEALHCSLRILDFVGMVLCPESEEAYTCLMQYITQCIYNEINP